MHGKPGAQGSAAVRPRLLLRGCAGGWHARSAVWQLRRQGVPAVLNSRRRMLFGDMFPS